MVERNAASPRPAYGGDEPYVFVAYSHQDSGEVYPEVAYLQESGFRVWYDEGTAPGSEWPEYIARAMEGAAQVLVFISPRSVRSQHVRNEINYALDHGKKLIAVHLEETELPPGLKLRLGTLQAIKRHELPPPSYKLKLIGCLQGEESAEPPEARPTGPPGAAAPATTPELKTRFWNLMCWYGPEVIKNDASGADGNFAVEFEILKCTEERLQTHQVRETRSIPELCQIMDPVLRLLTGNEEIEYRHSDTATWEYSESRHWLHRHWMMTYGRIAETRPYSSFFIMIQEEKYVSFSPKFADGLRPNDSQLDAIIRKLVPELKKLLAELLRLEPSEVYFEELKRDRDDGGFMTRYGIRKAIRLPGKKSSGAQG